jgi:hypothetical protein
MKIILIPIKRIFDVLSTESMPKPSIVAEDNGLRKECKEKTNNKKFSAIAAENFARFLCRYC